MNPHPFLITVWNIAEFSIVVPLPSAGSSGVGFWTALLDAEVSHKSLVSLLYCLTERPKQVSLPEMLQQVVSTLTSFRTAVPRGGFSGKAQEWGYRFCCVACCQIPLHIFFFPDLYGSSLCNLCCPALPSAASDARSVETWRWPSEQCWLLRGIHVQCLGTSKVLARPLVDGFAPLLILPTAVTDLASHFAFQ